ncbi:DUF4433 domain-containing protein [Nocardia vermiculata]|uniref:DUF4433 domain-containing protein n=2 Tax=Nocardia vermiculata TaxID=257274 RepID=A0A846XV41_9NOCA|nr:DUF4433 domain-containing protein [Nocardia vermiculata]
MIVEGLCSDSEASVRGLTKVSIAYDHIKARRARRRVGAGPQGTLADYVPFYLAPRSPMLYAIHSGNVSAEAADCTRIVYLCTTSQHLRDQGRTVVTTDRHAASALAEFTTDDQVFASSVDWQVMAAKYWKDTADDPDRSDRRQAELLVHHRVPWDNILVIATANEPVHTEVRTVLGKFGITTKVVVRPNWYF